MSASYIDFVHTRKMDLCDSVQSGENPPLYLLKILIRMTRFSVPYLVRVCLLVLSGEKLPAKKQNSFSILPVEPFSDAQSRRKSLELTGLGRGNVTKGERYRRSRISCEGGAPHPLNGQQGFGGKSDIIGEAAFCCTSAAGILAAS